MRPCSPAASFLLASTGLFVDDLLPSWPPPGYQGAAPSQMDTVSLRDDFSQRPIRLFSFWPARPSVAVPQVVPRARVCLLLAASRVRIWPCLAAVFPAHALPCHTMPRAPMLRVLQQLLSQPRLQARCWWFPWPGLGKHRPADMLTLVHAHRLRRIRLCPRQ